MANTQQTLPGADRNLRRHRALVAHLKAVGEWDLATLDQSHPIVASATLAEINAAINEAASRLRCPMQGKVERWMGGFAEFTLKEEPRWLPLREARFANLRAREFRYDAVDFIYNEIEVFQVCFKRIAHAVVYHVQPLSCPESSLYHRATRADGALVLNAPIGDMFVSQRLCMSTISTSMAEQAMRHGNVSQVPEWEGALHAMMISKI